jgi:hypothetical protein
LKTREMVPPNALAGETDQEKSGADQAHCSSGVAKTSTIAVLEVMKVWEAVGPLTFISMVALVEDWKRVNGGAVWIRRRRSLLLNGSSREAVSSIVDNIPNRQLQRGSVNTLLGGWRGVDHRQLINVQPGRLFDVVQR